MKIKKMLCIPLAVFMSFCVGCGSKEDPKDGENPFTPVEPSEPDDPLDPVDPGDPGEPEKTNVWPFSSISRFIVGKGCTTRVPIYTVYEEDLVYHGPQEDEYYLIELKGDVKNAYVTDLTNEGYALKEEYYQKGDVSILVSVNTNTIIKIYATSDITVVPEPEDEYDAKTLVKEISIKDDFGKHDPIETSNVSPFVFSFAKNDSSNNPKVDSDNGWKLYLYDKNSMTVTCTTKMKKIEFTFGDRKGTLSSDIGEFKTENTWSGDSKEVTITSSSQSRFTAIKITYVDPESALPVITGTSTIAEVYEAASQITYVPNDSGWYLSPVSVTVQIEAVDAIDSITTSGGLDPNARGKVLVVDSTGYIICSSATNSDAGIPFYQRVKQYLKSGTTQYVVNGKIAFLNGVVEIVVDSYRYNSGLVIEKNYDGYVKHTYTKQSDYINDATNNIVTNKNGYGVHDVIRVNGLTYFNKYNSKGSYLFLDQEGKIVPVYSVLDKDRTYLEKGKVYDIIGLESMYNGRPSLRILKVIKNETLDPTTLDFEQDIIHVDNLKQFYSLGMDVTNPKYVLSELTVYSADVYVSRYAEDKYTINTSYYYDSSYKEYTTGSSQNAAASHYALGVFNEELTKNQVLLDFLLENCKSVEECEDRKVTLYFTLAYRDTVDSKNMWRVNLFEDLVMSLDYYKSKSETITFKSTESTFSHDATSQTWSKGNITVKNESTASGDMGYDPSYLKIYDGTKLTISFDKPIIGFTLNTATYSYVAGLEGLEIYTYRQFASYLTVVLKEAKNEIVISDFAVGANRNNAYLRVDSMQVNYIG